VKGRVEVRARVRLGARVWPRVGVRFRVRVGTALPEPPLWR